MKILCIGDLHIQKRNVVMFKCFVDELMGFLDAASPAVDMVVFLGDTLHTMNVVHTQCMNLAIGMLDRVLAHRSNVHVKVLVGNHDYIGPNEKLTSNHWLFAIANRHARLAVIDRVVVDADHGFVYMPYVPMNEFWNCIAPFFATESQCHKGIQYVFCHQEFMNVQYEFGGVTSVDGDSLDDMEQELAVSCDDGGVLRIVSGHIHKKQWLKAQHGKIVVYYTGTPYQTRFNEAPDKTIAVLDTRTGKISEFELDVPKMMTVHKHVDEIYATRAQPLEFDPLNLYKLVVHVETQAQAQKFVRSDLYRKYAKRATILIEYDRSADVSAESSAVAVTSDNFKTLLHARVKDNANMLKLFNDFVC